MSDIRFNRWLHQSGTGGVYQDSAGSVGIGTTVPTELLDVQDGNIKIGSNIISSSGISTFSSIDVTTFNPTSLSVNGNNYPAAGPLSNRNLIINGAMQVAQRATGITTITTYGYRTCDRYAFSLSNLGTWDVDQATDAPEGFTKSFKVTCTVADVNPAAGDVALFAQYIEAQNLQHLKYGTSNAENLTMSFWVKSNKTGNASLESIQFDNSDRQFTTSYTINSANTWEYKTITIPGDSAGIINDDNGIGISVSWWLNSGSTYNTGTHGPNWEAADDNNRNATNLGVGGATSDYFAITGVQLELGDVATPFEHRSYGDELQKCFRYYVDTRSGKPLDLNTIGPAISIERVGETSTFPVSMRIAPDVTIYAGSTETAGKVNLYNNLTVDVGSGFVARQPSSYGFHYVWNGSGLTVGNYYQFRYSADAEL